jgi:hypothetical protein
VGRYPIDEFLWGLAAGVVAMLLAFGVAALADRLHARGGPQLATGLPMVAAALVAIRPSHTPTAEVLIGLSGVTAVVIAATRMRVGTARLPLVLVMSPVFAWLLATDASSVAWVRAAVVAGATIGSVVVTYTDLTWGATGVTPVLYVISAAGVFAAVPNTREAAALLGASVPAAACGWPLYRARLGTAGGACATALLVWVAAVGAVGREPAVVGAIACLGLLATLPAGPWLARRWIGPTIRRYRVTDGPVPMLVIQTVVVAVASRVAGITSELRVAIPVAAAALAGALIASVWLQPVNPSPGPLAR